MPLPPLPLLYLQSLGQETKPASLTDPLAAQQQPSADIQSSTSDKNRKRPRKEKEKDSTTPRSAVASPTGSVASSASGGAADASKSRKPTYLLQKEERDELEEEMRALEAQLETLKTRVGLPTNQDRDAVAAMQGLNFDLEEQIHASRLYLTRIQTLVGQELNSSPVRSMSHFIHLPCDMEERRRILRALREEKLLRAEEVAINRLHHLDHTQPYLSEQHFITDDGNFHCHRQEINPFPNFKSARQLYDAVVAFLYNWEISVSELLNQLAIREDSPDEFDFDPTIWNPRIVTVADDVGCTEELNLVIFARFRDAAASEMGSPVGVITSDTVDVDDLYPYRPEERTSKRSQVAHLVYEIPRPGHATPLVVLKSCSFTIQLPAQFEVAPGVEEKLRENISRWPVTMLKFLHSYAAR